MPRLSNDDPSRHEPAPDACSRAEAEEVSPEDRDFLAELRRSIHDRAERPDTYWEAQRWAIQLRLRQKRQVWRCRPVWVSVAATIILAALLAIFGLRHEKPSAPKVVNMSEHELLLGVDRALDKRVPAALEPALLLTQELQKESREKR